MPKRYLLLAVLVLVALTAALVVFALYLLGTKREAVITNFDECLAAGHPVMESYPRQCRTPAGQTFVEDVVIDSIPGCAEKGEMCGSIAGILCCEELICDLEGSFPDAAGTCVER